MSCCSSCNQSVHNDVCGCGCGSCKPWSTAVNGFSCPPPPPPPICGYRCIDGVQIPVYDPVHPLLPIARSRYPQLLANIKTCCDCDEASQQALGQALGLAELQTSTCSFPGDRYYDGVMLYAMAWLEFQERSATWDSQQNSMIAHGRYSNITPPKLEDTFAWQMRERIAVRRFAVFGNVAGGHH